MAIAEERAKAPLGQLLYERGAVDRTALYDLLEHHRKERVPLGEALISHGAAREEDVWNALAAQWGFGVTDLEHHWVDPALANELDAREAIAHRVIPLRAGGGAVIVAMADPRDRRARAYVEQALNL